MDRYRPAVVAAALLVVVGVVFAAPGEASFPGAGDTLFFTGHDTAAGGDPHLYSVRSDGTALTTLTSGASGDLTVRGAPGGPLVVARDTHDQCGHLFWRAGYDLFTLNRDGSGLTRLTDNCPTDDTTPAWSPSGRHLVLSRFGELWSMRSDGTGLAKLTCSGADDDFAPDWSPDGTQIAFDHVNDVDLMTAAGAGVRKVATGSRPSFSPDGTKLAYAGPAFSSAQGIHILTLASSDDVRLTSGYDGAPVWSPDGAAIAFVHAVDPTRSWEIQTIGVDGGGLRTITGTPSVTSLDWPSDSASTASEPDVAASDTSCAETAPPPPAPIVQPPPAAVLAPAPTNVAASAVAAPNRLRVGGVAFRPRVLRSRRAFTLTVAVRDLAGRAVRGAAVWARALRGDAAPTSPRLTRADGTVTLRVVPNRRLPLSAGRRLVLTVQARRPQDGWTSKRTGVRLVSVRTAAGH